MDTLLSLFRDAQVSGSGSDLAKTLSPVSPSIDPNRLRNFFRDSDAARVEHDVRARILSSQFGGGYRIGKHEGKAWIEVYVALWRFAAELYSHNGSGSGIGGGGGGAFSSPASAAAAAAAATGAALDWNKVYVAWREVSNALIKGYSGGHFAAWTIPCLYLVGKFLRVFAMRADEQATATATAAAAVPVDYASGFQDDVTVEPSKNEKLEDAARVINRIFTLCISDRYVSSSFCFSKRFLFYSEPCSFHEI
jgi:hypothetical protein